MVNYFWKKITLLNFGLFIITFRIFGLIYDFLNKKINNDSIFPKVSENGYSFKEAINYNFEDIKSISKDLSISFNKKIINNSPFLNNFCFNKDKLGFFDSINFSLNNNSNYNNIIVNQFSDIEKLDYIMKLNNKFYFRENQVKSIELYNTLINGYRSYLILQLNQEKGNIQNIKQNKMIQSIKHYLISSFSNNSTEVYEILSSEKGINDLFYLYTLSLITYTTIDNIMKNIKINHLLEYHEDEIFSYISKLISTNNIDSKNFTSIFLHKVIPLINYLGYNNTDKYSLEISSLDIIIKVIFSKNKQKLSFKEEQTFKYFLRQLTNTINEIFLIDSDIKKISEFYKKYNIVLFVIYWALSFVFVFFSNKNFIKHKEFYSSKTRMLENTNKTAEYKKMRRYIENLRKIQLKQKGNKNKMNEYTPEELQYIENLSKNSSDKFVVSK